MHRTNPLKSILMICAIFFIVFLFSGCASLDNVLLFQKTPDKVSDCETMYPTEQKIEACKNRVRMLSNIRMNKQKEEDAKNGCNGYWDPSSKICRDRPPLMPMYH